MAAGEKALCVFPAEAGLLCSQIRVVFSELVPFVAFGGEVNRLAGQPISIPTQKQTYPMRAMGDDVFDH